MPGIVCSIVLIVLIPRAKIGTSSAGDTSTETVSAENATTSGEALHILSQANTHTGKAVSYKGQQTFDPDRFQDILAAPALEMLKGLPNASGLLNRRGGEMVYTFEWEQKPRQTGP